MQIAKPAADRAADTADKGADHEREACKCSEMGRDFSRRIDCVRGGRDIRRLRRQIGQGHCPDRDDCHDHGGGGPGQQAVCGIPEEDFIGVQAVPAHAEPAGEIASHRCGKPLGYDQPETGTDGETLRPRADARP